MSESGITTGIQNLAYIEQMYVGYQSDPQSVSMEWREFFSSADTDAGDTVRLGPAFKPRTVFSSNGAATTPYASHSPDSCTDHVSVRLHQMLRNYREQGHLSANTNPLNPPPVGPPELELDHYGFTEPELNLFANIPELNYAAPLSIREIFHRLRDTYCGSIGAQFMHIDSMVARQWLQKRLESTNNRTKLSPDNQVRILTRLTEAVVFEEFLRTKFLGAKTFSLEGSESLLPLLDLAIERASLQGVKNIVIGMGHRGRLNVLANIVGKHACEIFEEFTDARPEVWPTRGDVKYHLGHSDDITLANGRKIHLSLCFNPSHLEFVDPVVMGRVRAHQDRIGDHERRQVLGLLIHGDAAFAGEGVIQEILNLSQLPGYAIGGVIHVIVNNQIGFTTSPHEGRSTRYATDVARTLQAPIFHVNGEDLEAVSQVVQLALDYRLEFKSDVFIDLYGYRRLGHNETDEPTFTQPLLYQKISERPNVREIYLNQLHGLKSVTRDQADQIVSGCKARLEQQLSAAGADQCGRTIERRGIWREFTGGPEPADDPDTGMATRELASLLQQLSTLPAGFQIHPKLERGLSNRRAMADGQHPIDWAAAEALALGGLAINGIRIRLTGQDTGRGTFSQRHAILYDQKDGHNFTPLQHLALDQSKVEICNSPLCETGALGFEYGYSLDYPNALVLWEAQFGDFANAAQVIIDQFITSAEDKWRRLSGLVMLLPHGFEGMGPEHSSARLERFLTLAAEDNIQIVQPSTPAQYFHVLRRQSIRRWRKPLVIFTPKSLLRHPHAVSALANCALGRFKRVLTDDFPTADVRRILLCSGKVYYDLAAYREEHGRKEIAIVRLEQLYPLPVKLLEETLALYDHHVPALWVQEEPSNMGAWRYLHERFARRLFDRRPFALISRVESASPATGSSHAHKLEQAQLIARAFGDPEPGPESVLAVKKQKPESAAAESDHPQANDSKKT